MSTRATLPATEDLQVFATIADFGTMSGAAKYLRLPKSTLSRRLSRLEATLGVRLFARNRHRLQLTGPGEALLEQAREALDSLLGIVDMASHDHDHPRGRLRVSIPQDLLCFEAIWIDFLERHPLIALELQPSNRYVDVVAERFDLALRGGRGDDEAVIAHRVGTYALIAVAAPRYVEEHGALRAAEELRQHSCVLLHAMRRRPGHPDHPELPHRHVVCPDTGMALAACRRGLGIAILPRALLGADLEAGTLVPVLDAYNPLEVPLYAVLPERAYVRAPVTAFIDFVKTRFGAEAASGDH